MADKRRRKKMSRRTLSRLSECQSLKLDIVGANRAWRRDGDLAAAEACQQLVKHAVRASRHLKLDILVPNN